MALTRVNGALDRVLLFCYIILKGHMYSEMLKGTRSISSSFYVSKIFTAVEISTTSSEIKYKPTNMAMSTKLIKITKFIQYSVLTALTLVSGDESPNPGWTYSALSLNGLKFALLNVRSLPRHLDKFKILMNDSEFDIVSQRNLAKLNMDGFRISIKWLQPC